MIFSKKTEQGNGLKTKKVASRLGVINTSLFSYLTPLMIIIALVIVTIVLANVDKLYKYFETNVYLNGLIIFLLFVALFRAFHHNYKLFRTARVLKKIELTSNKDVIDEQEVDSLHKAIIKNAYLIDTQNMHNGVANLNEFGHLNFTDNDARLIKHKLGYRIGLRRSSVGFLAGILVMLGLLGTFLGLLKTIDAVGLAMGSMSAIGSDGSVDESAMTGFISSLSAPLQGMGLAFSSSLFGLSGSLLIGFFNHLCGGAQDKFIETVGRWVDDRIPQFKPTDDVMPDGSGLATEDDLNSWLTGFVYLSVKTNKKLGFLTQTLVENIKQQADNSATLDNIARSQVEAVESLGDIHGELKGTKLAAHKQFEGTIHALESNNKAIESLAETSQKTMQNISENVYPTLSNALSSFSELNEVTSQNFEHINKFLLQRAEHHDNKTLEFTSVATSIDNKLSSSNQNLEILNHAMSAKLDAMQEAHKKSAKHESELYNTALNTNETIAEISSCLNELKGIQAKTGESFESYINNSDSSNASLNKLEKLTLEMSSLLNRLEGDGSRYINKILGIDVKK